MLPQVKGPKNVLVEFFPSAGFGADAAVSGIAPNLSVNKSLKNIIIPGFMNAAADSVDPDRC